MTVVHRADLRYNTETEISGGGISVYQIQHEKCRLCLGCLQVCPVYAVELRSGKVSVNTARCVNCGACFRACSHGAVTLRNQTAEVQELLKAGRKVILSVDDACRDMLPDSISMEQLVSAVRKLGFHACADATEAVVAVAEEYARLLGERRMENVIFSQCPVVRSLVEQYHPALMRYLAPVASPMIAHGRMLKNDQAGIAVVYLSPCGARISESEDVRHSTEINAVLTLPELLAWLRDAQIDPAACTPEPMLPAGETGVRAASAGGMLACVNDICPNHGYSCITADGVDRCMAVLEQLEHAQITGAVVELSACAGGCVGGAGGGISRQAYIRGRTAGPHTQDRAVRRPDVAMANPAIDRTTEPFRLDEEQIQSMLDHIGVGNPRQQKNCGDCGYATCRERAEAILRHQEPLSLCRRNVHQARMDVYSKLFDQLPLAALLVDEDQKVVAFNKEAAALFSIRPGQEKYIFELMDPVDFQYVLDTGLAIKNRRMDIPEIYMRVEASLVPLKQLGMVLGLFEDITQVEEQEAKLQSARLQSVEMAQKVIEKQMTVAQQIAFLLGETTAETKVTLNQLKQRILGEEEQS